MLLGKHSPEWFSNTNDFQDVGDIRNIQRSIHNQFLNYSIICLNASGSSTPFKTSGNVYLMFPKKATIFTNPRPFREAIFRVTEEAVTFIPYPVSCVFTLAIHQPQSRYLQTSHRPQGIIKHRDIPDSISDMFCKYGDVR